MPAVQCIFSLRRPNQAEWAGDSGFNRRLHPRLLEAHTAVLASTTAQDERPRVERELKPLLDRSMSNRQRMLVYYLLTHCARTRDLSLTIHFHQALEWLARADELAAVEQDYGAQVDLYELRGTLCRAVSLYRDAAEAFSRALHILEEHTPNPVSYDPEFEATLAAKAATMDYLLGRFPRALEHLEQAAARLPRRSVSVSGRGTVAWAFALLHRQRNSPLDALMQVEVATALYRQLGPSNSTCRVLALAAEICLDVVESPIGDLPAARATHLNSAQRYVGEALKVGRQVDDPPGIELCKLALARLNRVRDPAGATENDAIIRATIRQARRMRDDSLLTAAQTALGEDLLARGEIPAAKRWLRQAVATAERIHTPGLAFHARRRLRQAEGRNA